MITDDRTTFTDGADGRRFDSGDDLRYSHVVREFASRAWALHLPTLAIIQDLLRYRAHGYRLSREEIDERIAAGQERSAAARSNLTARGGVAVIPLYGIVAQRASAFQSVSSPSGTSVEEFTRMLRTALADDAVDSILIEIDSPGGSVDGVPELANELRNARGKKPLVAIANTLAASAAYWIGSQCDELVVTPSGEVGSIGVYCAHQDFSTQLEQDGVKLTLISAGKYKTEGNPWQPLSEEALAAIQQQVDDFYGMFVDAVAKGRGVSVSQVRDGFGQGRTVLAKQAVAGGMADRVDTFDNTLARLMRGGATSRRRSELAGGATVERLALEPGDKILVRVTENLDETQLTALKAMVEERFPGHQAVVHGPNLELSFLSEISGLVSSYGPNLLAAAVSPHSTEVIDEPWDGPGQEAKLSEPITKARGTGMYAWYDDAGKDPDGDGYPDAKADWKFPHHMVSDGNPGPANVNGVRNALARLTDAQIPEGDKAGVRAHLQRHLDDFDAPKGKGAASLADQVGETHGPETPARAELDAEAVTRLLSRPGFRRAYSPDKEDA